MQLDLQRDGMKLDGSNCCII